MGEDPREPSWLYQYAPREWLRAALGELRQARDAYGRHNGRAGLAGCRRAAGVALHGAFAARDTYDPCWGRTYMDHLAWLSTHEEAPEEVRAAARRLVEAALPGGSVVPLRTAQSDAKDLDAAEAVMAWSYAEVVRREPVAPEGT